MKESLTLTRRIAGEWYHLAARQSRSVQWMLLKNMRDEVTIKSRQGNLTCKTHDTGISPYLWLNREYEYGFSVRCLKFLRERGLLPPGPVNLYDIGANIGFIGIGLLKEGLVDHVVGFEPDPGNFRLYERNIAQNGLNDKISPVQMALSSVATDLVLELSACNVGDHRIRMTSDRTAADPEGARETISVLSQTLDQFVAGPNGSPCPPSVAWIDVQGHEGFIFQGGRETLRGNVPVVSEICPYMIQRAGIGLDEFNRIICDIWNYFWVERKKRFVRYPTALFSYYLEELGTDGEENFGNVIFTSTAGNEPPTRS